MNSKNSILLVDPEFDPHSSPNCNLLIRITADSFSYAIIDKSSNQLKAVYDEQKCSDVSKVLSVKLETDGYLGLPFKETKASVYTENSISIPNELFDDQHLNDYAKFFTEEQSDNLYTQPFTNFGFTTIFTLNQSMEEAINSSLDGCKLFNHAAPVLAAVNGTSEKILLLDFTAGSFNALYIDHGKLIFHNYYQIDHTEEFNYYLLFMINQLNIDTLATELHLSGIIHAGDGNFQCIEKYFERVIFNERSSEELDNRILDDMPAHYYSSLLALDLCV